PRPPSVPADLPLRARAARDGERVMTGEPPRSEEHEPRAVAPALIAGAARGAPAGLANGCATLFVFMTFLPGAHVQSDFWIPCVLFAVVGTILGSALSAGDAASRR